MDSKKSDVIENQKNRRDDNKMMTTKLKNKKQTSKNK